ncbi:MAG: RNA polymerase sporulation sigma factor SigK [Clostridia bacterium]|nr:RNA polymerase sporulation sigma factor SigK [Clostridia bacterium]
MIHILGYLFQNVFMFSYVSGGNSFPPQLSEDEEEKYLDLYAKGDMAAKNILIEHNLRLVAHVTRKYSGCGIENDDLISIGTIGLIKAVSTYKPDKRIRIATYAARCIENEVLMVLRSGKKLQNEVSLNEPIGFDKEGNEVSLMDVLQSDDGEMTERIEQKDKVSYLYRIIKSVLSGREAEVLQKRYGLYGGRAKTQREIAKEMGISRSYVSRIEKKAINKLTENFDMM